MTAPQKYAALFVDFENVFHYLKNHLDPSLDPTDTILALIRHLRQYLDEHYSEQVIIQHAYADFERIEQNAQGPLYLLGVETHNVLGTDRKNAADMKLCIDAMETLYTRGEIRTFVFMAGDRDYIPVLQHLKKHARTVRVAAFPIMLSGDLLTLVGKEFFLDATSLLPDTIRLQPGRPRPMPSYLPPPAPAGANMASQAPSALIAPGAPSPAPAAPRRWNSTSVLATPDQHRALEIIFKYFANKPEVFMTPYLHRLRAELPQLAEQDRKALITELVDAGAIVVEKRQGEPNDYSVILVNWNHPDVQSVHPGR